MKRFGRIGYLFIAVGIAFIAIGITNRGASLAIGVTFLVVGFLMLQKK
jgi:hypothetical protein